MKRKINMKSTMIYKEDLMKYMKNTYAEVANDSYLKMVDKIVVTLYTAVVAVKSGWKR